VIAVTEDRRTLALAMARLGQPVTVLPGARPRADLLPGKVLAVHAGPGGDAPGQVTAGTVETLLRQARDRRDVTVSLDLDIDPDMCAAPAAVREQWERQVALAHVVRVSAADLAVLYPGVPATAVLAAWHAEGLPCGIATLGSDGAYLLAPNGVAYRRAGFRVRVRDTTGAADAFTAGALATLALSGALGDHPVDRLAGVSPQQWLAVLDHAGLAAALACARPGANPPTHDDICAARAA